MLIRVKALRRVVLDRVINAGDVVDMHVSIARLLYVSGDVKTHVDIQEPNTAQAPAQRGRPKKSV
jgi:hypothetical protein